MNHRLQQLLNIYLTGKLTEDQREELAAFLDKGEATEQLEELIQQQLSRGEFSISGDMVKTEDKIVKRVLEKIGSASVVALTDRRIPMLRKWGWAAAILLLIGAGAGFWLTQRHPESSSANGNRLVHDDVGPGSDKAILTLADGTTIYLDSAANGPIAQEGNASIVKQANGGISYHLKGAATEGIMMNTMHTPRGGQYSLVLPDGTQVWLNAASSITYPVAFTGKERKVRITGEAYFEVAKNKELPFIVNVDDKSSIEVLGTHFNVNSYADENAIRTTLLEGSVMVNGAVLKPGQQARVDRQRLSVLNNADIDKVMAWRNGLFNFEDASLEEVMRQLARWYDVEVIYQKGIPDIRFEGEISRNIQLSNLLKVLARAEVKFKIEEGRRLVVLP
jgi:ferric-dicitrate binding protein FerR (iron transport regulator)